MVLPSEWSWSAVSSTSVLLVSFGTHLVDLAVGCTSQSTRPSLPLPPDVMGSSKVCG